MSLPSPLPDSPSRWEGWRNYNSDDPYLRLCLDFTEAPTDEQIEENCRQLLVWWQKKLPLKNQPANPVTQMLRDGIDDAPRYLAEARKILLDPESRREADGRLRARLRDGAVAEFNKFLAFALGDNVLKPEDENNLYHIGSAAGLVIEEMRELVEGELLKRGAARYVAPVPVVAAPSGGHVGNGNGANFAPVAGATSPPRIAPGGQSSDPASEFARLIRLSGLADDMTDDQRDALCNMGENLGLTGGQAEDLIDVYLDELNGVPAPVAPKSTSAKPAAPKPAPAKPAAAKPAAKADTFEPDKFSPLHRAREREEHRPFTASSGAEMLFVPSGSFMMGSMAEGSAPNEQPLCKTNVTCFFIARLPVTNAQYERFDPTHSSKRPGWAKDDHPVVYVSSIEAAKYCEWLSRNEGKKFRLPTEAEWEYAARGTDGRSYPWGERLNRGDLANFADCNTNFPWRDTEINDGFAETAPVGSFPKGASPYGVEDMSGNVWEWCLDFFETYKEKERTNPRNLSSNGRRIYRGGSWKSRANSLRTTARNFNNPEYSANDVGFRVVCEC